ncbi:hypothetical protein KFL_000080480 [Klebsormidium nitens]|uniref:Transmembrane protein n=1 Tax=Klebsormidium nitens TaxID=105231 RepID=A0A1Y1HKJ2_KLENI|nr:hypothetical protein KFL_000080480 [Klebsormidium nitens]|eukprot:GAQ78142.1 hypothetical protein KFL_000080480 [Klebsormidium nitens]
MGILSLLPPSDVEGDKEQCCAWRTFVFIMLLPLLPTIFYIIGRRQARDHPAISSAYEAQDINLPYFYICPTPTSTVFDDIILYGFVASCQFISGDSPPFDYNATLPLMWNASRTADRVFEVVSSNCPVQTTVTNYGLCFGYNLTGYTVKKDDYIGDTIALSITFTYRSPPADPLFQRTYFLLSTFSSEPLPNQTTSIRSRFIQELPLSQQARLTLSLMDSVDLNKNHDRTGTGESIYTLPPFDGQISFYPSGPSEIAIVNMRLNSRGVNVVKAIDPWSWFELATQVYAYYGYAMLGFGLLYAVTVKRKEATLWRTFLSFASGLVGGCITALKVVGKRLRK